MACQACAHCCAVHSRWHNRYGGASDWGGAGQATGSVRDCGKQARCRHSHWRGLCGQATCRWLYAGVRGQQFYGQQDAGEKPALRHQQRLAACGADGAVRACAGNASVERHQDIGRSEKSGFGQAWQPDLCLVWQRYIGAPIRRFAVPDDGHRHDSCALQRSGPGADRFAGRAGQRDVWQLVRVSRSY